MNQLAQRDVLPMLQPRALKVVWQSVAGEHTAGFQSVSDDEARMQSVFVPVRRALTLLSKGDQSVGFFKAALCKHVPVWVGVDSFLKEIVSAVIYLRSPIQLIMAHAACPDVIFGISRGKHLVIKFVDEATSLCTDPWNTPPASREPTIIECPDESICMVRPGGYQVYDIEGVLRYECHGMI